MRGLGLSVGLVKDYRGGLQQTLIGFNESSALLTSCLGNSACPSGIWLEVGQVK